jgi:hypothetical protein
MKNIFSICAILLALTLVGCSSLSNSIERTTLNFGSKPAQITCYSGGKVIYQGTSLGKVTDSSTSDGFFFQDKEGFIEIVGDCVFRY